MLSLAPDPDFVESGSNPDPDYSPPKSSSTCIYFFSIRFLGTVLTRLDLDPNLNPLTQLNPDPIRIRTPALQKTPENMNFLFSLFLFGDRFRPRSGCTGPI